MTNIYSKPVIALLMALLLLACRQEPSAFDRWLNKLEAEQPLAYFEQSPDSFYVVSPEELLQEIRKLDQSYAALEALGDSILPQSHWGRRKAWMQRIEGIKSKWSACRNDPSLYNLPGYCRQLLADEGISLVERLGFIQERLARSEAYYRAAKQLIREPLANKTLLGAQKHLLGLQFLTRELPDSLRKASFVPELNSAFHRELAQTRLVVKDYLAYCESLYFELHDEWGRNKDHETFSR